MSTAPFRTRIREAIADEALQAALDANALRRTTGRAAAFASLPDWQERRERAHAVRADVIAHMDKYLAAFGARLAANGIHVHHAADARQAIETVIEIARTSRAQAAMSGGDASSPQRGSDPELLFAKSKSMVSEEIELNRALGEYGYRVVETDLGEYIVQLRGEKPAHIITPAVHLQRRQIGELFHEKLGMDFTDDIPTLTTAARKVLRNVFLTADVGISGVNFGVAATGTLCIVTNEGNGRMVTTLPPVHIALMGMERLVPTLDDLALMLSLLPRSATGQKLSVYTQLIHSPRRHGEVDGATERHVIILDNGRTRIGRSGLREALYCIRCGACLNACPVFREIGGHAYVGADGEPAPYPGPIGSVVSPGLLGLQEFGHLAQASSLCGACKDACPVNIDLPQLLTRVRAGEPVDAPRRVGIGLSAVSRVGLLAYGAIAASPRLFGFSQRLAAVGAWLISPSSTWIRLPKFTGWGFSKDLPRPAAKPFRARWADRRRGALATPNDAEPFATPPRIVPSSAAPATVTPGAMGHLANQDPVHRFVAELGAVGAEVHRVTMDDLQDALLGFLRVRSTVAVLAWDHIDGLDWQSLDAAGIQVLPSPNASVPVGITGCACAIAETGTLVLTTGAGRPMTTSLLPRTHIAIVHPSQIVWTLEQALRNPDVADSAATVLVTGPSRTADIEMTLTIGVHGPGELVVYIVE